nr:guanine nucleotide-binding protein G(I)/G(S)/G(O) subunit gamma-10 isoform X2 [Manis javanica]
MSGAGIYSAYLTYPTKCTGRIPSKPQADLQTCYCFAEILPVVTHLQESGTACGTEAFTTRTLLSPPYSHLGPGIGGAGRNAPRPRRPPGRPRSAPPRGPALPRGRAPLADPATRLRFRRLTPGSLFRRRKSEGGVSPFGTPNSLTRGAGSARKAGGRSCFPAPGRRPGLGFAAPIPPRRLAARRRRHVLRGRRERPAAPGGAAQAGGRRGEDQGEAGGSALRPRGPAAPPPPPRPGVSGGCRASTVLHAECLPGCPAGGGSSWKQPLPRAQILCFTLKTEL